MIKDIDVIIEGTMPLLMHRFAEAAQASVPGGEAAKGQVRSNTAGEDDSARVAATKVAYIQPDGFLYFPIEGVARLIREQGSTMKAKGSRKSLKYIVPAAVLMASEVVSLYDTDRKTRLRTFEVDSRPVTIPATKGRVMRHRPKLPQWVGKFILRINCDLLTEATVRELLTMGGMCIGLGDFRPSCGGSFGTFSVVHWAEVVAGASEMINGHAKGKTSTLQV